MALTQTEALKIVTDSGLARVEDLEGGGCRIVLATNAQTNWRIIIAVPLGGAAMLIGGWAARHCVPQYVQYAPFGGVPVLMFLGALMVLIGLLCLIAPLIAGSPGDITVDIRSDVVRVQRCLWRRPHINEYPVAHIHGVVADAFSVSVAVDGRPKALTLCADEQLRTATAWAVATTLWGPDGVESNRDPGSRAPCWSPRRDVPLSQTLTDPSPDCHMPPFGVQPSGCSVSSLSVGRATPPVSGNPHSRNEPGPQGKLRYHPFPPSRLLRAIATSRSPFLSPPNTTRIFRLTTNPIRSIIVRVLGRGSIQVCFRAVPLLISPGRPPARVAL